MARHVELPVLVVEDSGSCLLDRMSHASGLKVVMPRMMASRAVLRRRAGPGCCGVPTRVSAMTHTSSGAVPCMPRCRRVA
jgi:hypothetical protein